MRPRCSIRLALAPVLAFAALCVGAPAAISAPTFGAPVDVAPADQQAAAGPSATYDGGGLLEIGWATLSGEETQLLSTARRPPGGAFAPGPNIASSEEEVDGPEFATAPDGQIFVASMVADADGLGRIYASRLGAGGEPVDVVQVSATGDAASDPAIAVGADGRVAIAWTVTDEDSDNGTVRAVHGTLGMLGTRRIVSGGVPDASTPAVAFDSAGILQIAFTSLGSDDRIKVAAETPAGPFAASRFVTPVGVTASDPAIAPAPGGGLAIAWTEDAGETEIVKVGVEPVPGMAFAAAGVPGGDASGSARLAVDPATSTLAVAWIRSPAGVTEGSALVATRAAGGAIEAPQVVSGADRVTAIDIAFSTAGDAVLTWRRERGTPIEPAGDIRAALFDAPRASPPPPPPPPGPGPPALLPPPPPVLPPLTLTSFAVDPKCIRYGSPSKGARKRLSFGFVLSQAASLRLAIQRRQNSRPLRDCPSRRVRGEPGRLGPAVVVDLAAGGGPGAVSVGDVGEAVDPRSTSLRRSGLTLRLPMNSGRRRIVLRQFATTLVPGTYVATATAMTADGRSSGSTKVKFWVLRRSTDDDE